MEAEREAELHSNWPAYVQRLERDRDAGWAAADALALVLRNTGHILRVPAAEYVPAIGDAFTELDKGLVAYTAARAKRTT